MSKFYYYILIICLIFSQSCSKTKELSGCTNAKTIDFLDGVCLEINHQTLSDSQKELIHHTVLDGISQISKIVILNDLVISIDDNLSRVIPEIGLGGFNPAPNEVIISIDPTFGQVEASISENLIPLLAHEIHHALRRRSVGYGSTLLEAIITEGLADHFSIEVTDIQPPPWTVALSESELKHWIIEAEETWNNKNYNHNAWFFGTDNIKPRWTGYSMGFYLVDLYLKDFPETKPSTLHDVQAQVILNR